MTHSRTSLLVPDEEIVRRVQRGDTKSFGILFERHYLRLERLLRQMGFRGGDLEDLLAETFTRAFTRIASFNPDEGSRYVSYLCAIARNLGADHLRRHGRIPPTSLLADAADQADRGAGPEEMALRREEIDTIRRAFQRLNASDREIIILSYDQELNCREIMAIMGKPSISAVTTHLYKAMKRLRELVRSVEPTRP
jgi:RNA polymerase sigma-70 factor, ECF subfamily